MGTEETAADSIYRTRHYGGGVCRVSVGVTSFECSTRRRRYRQSVQRACSRDSEKKYIAIAAKAPSRLAVNGRVVFRGFLVRSIVIISATLIIISASAAQSAF